MSFGSKIILSKLIFNIFFACNLIKNLLTSYYLLFENLI